MKVEVLGKTTLGEDMFMAVISSEENIRNLKHIQEIARELTTRVGSREDELLPRARRARSSCS